MIKNIKSKSRKDGDKIAFCLYAFDIGNGIVKVGYTNDLDRRETEHLRTYGQAVLLGAVQLSTYTHGDRMSFAKAKATAFVIEQQVHEAMSKTHKIYYGKQNKNTDTERYYMDESIPEVDVKVRKTYKLRIC